jgi:predicted XRE-type DNA-binding protein
MAYANKVAMLKDRRGEQVAKAYSIWVGMRRRINAPRGRDVIYYKNLTIEKSWDDFEIFLSDMGSPKLHESIDRINNLLGYSKENCRWADATMQSRNRLSVKLNPDMVGRIKMLYETTKITQMELKKLFNVSQNMVSCVIRGKNWVI